MLPPLTRGQVLLRMTRHDGKAVELDPGHVILIEPPLVDDDDKETILHLDGNVKVRLAGGHEQNAALIQTARSMASEILLETLIDSIRASATPVPATELN